MKFIKSIAILSILFNITLSHASFVAVVNVPKTTNTTSTASNLIVSKDSLEAITGTYKTTNTELFYSDFLISEEGCEVELSGSSTSGSWTYYNSVGCSDNDEITFLTTDGLTETVSLWANASPCEYLNNGWLDAAFNGSIGLIFNESSCSINGSDILTFLSFDSIPAYYLSSINIDIFSNPEGEESGEGGEGIIIEGEEIGEGIDNQSFNMPNIQYVFGDIVVDHPFLDSIDVSNLRYVLGDKVILRGMQNITSFDLSNLRNYSNNPLDINVMGAMLAERLNISRLTRAGDIDISYTNISDISDFKNLKYGRIITNADSEIYFTQVEVFPNYSSDFCRGIRRGDIYLTSSISQANAIDACT